MVYGQQKKIFLGDFEEDIKYIDSIKKRQNIFHFYITVALREREIKKGVSDTCRDSNTGM